MIVATGTYTGDGADGRAITGVGFQPDVVFIQPTTSNHPVIKTSTMAGDTTHISSSALVADYIQSLDADGFTVGTNVKVNENLQAMYWVALKDNGAGDLKVGSYTGDGLDNRAITGTGFQPALVITMSESASDAWIYHSAQHAGDSSQIFGTALAGVADKIQSLDADGFTVGTLGEANRAATVIHWIAIKAVAGMFSTGNFTGDGTDNRSITGVGFTPAWVVSQADSATRAYHKTTDMGTGAHRWGTLATADDIIQAMEADGFQVGAGAGGNVNTVVYRFFAIKAGTTSAAGGGGGGRTAPVIPTRTNFSNLWREW